MSEPESLASDEPAEAHLCRHALDRLIMLSDGVFAIAITLAAVEIRIPENLPTLAAVLTAIQVPLLAFFISFMVIAVFWTSNRDLFARLVTVDRPLTGLVLAMLCVVALIPASSHVAQGHGGGGALDGSFRFYALTMVVSGGLNLAAWLYASRKPGVMRADVPRPYRHDRIATAATIPLLFLAVLLFPTTRALRWMAPVALVLIAARRFVLPRLLARHR